MVRLTHCILRAGGKKFDPDEFLQKFTFANVLVFRKGEKRLIHKNRYSGISVDISSGKHIDSQLKDILSFIGKHRKALIALKNNKGIEYLILDFGILMDQDVIMKSILISPEVMRAAGELNIGINMSHYLTC